jgi:hypothetical protein
MIDGRKGFLAPAIFTPEVVKAFHKQCEGFKSSNDGTPIPPCMGYRIGADENPFGSGAKDELWGAKGGSNEASAVSARRGPAACLDLGR